MGYAFADSNRLGGSRRHLLNFYPVGSHECWGVARVSTDGRSFLKALSVGDGEQTEIFFRRMSDTIWRTCSILTRNEAGRRQVFSEACAALSADRFRILQRYNGRVPLNRYVALTVRQILYPRLLELIRESPNEGWIAFEAWFKNEIDLLIRKYFRNPPESDRDDAYQAVQIGLIDNHYRRILLYSGEGNFREYILSATENLIRDFVRQQRGRRREPMSIQRLSPLDRKVFQVMYGQDSPWLDRLPEPNEVLAALPPNFARGLTTEEARAAIDRVLRVVPPDYNLGGRIFVELPPDGSVTSDDGQLGGTTSDDGPVPGESPDHGPNPEQALSDKQAGRLWEVAVVEFEEGTRDWPAIERDRLRELLDGAGSRRGRPPTGIDQSIRQRAKRLSHYPAMGAYLAHIRNP